MVLRNDIAIICGKCHKQVDALVMERNFYNDTIIYTAVCHGEEETSILTGIDLMESFKIEGAIAFIQPLALAGGNKDG